MKMGKSRVSCTFFEENRLELNQVFRHSYPLLTAIVLHAPVLVLQELLDLGAEPDGPFRSASTSWSGAAI
jgi:hypothetical protein